MDTDQHPLLQLPPEKQRDLANLVDSDEIDVVAEKTGYSRRQILGMIAALGTGAAVGGYSLSELVGVVEAAADTTDSDGNVGLPDDRVDVFADGVDLQTLNTADIENASSGTVPTAQGDGTMAMQAVAGGSDFHWTEDANSPFTASGGSINVQLADSGSQTLVNWVADKNSTAGDDVRCEINGITSSSYTVTSYDGGNTFNSSDSGKIAFGVGNETVSGTLWFGKGNGKIFCNVLGSVASSGTDVFGAGSPPLSQFTLISSDADWSVEVYHNNP